jgi:hypothetical protein
MLEYDFVANISILKPKPSFLYLEVEMEDRNVLWVDKKITHSFMSRKLNRELGLADA